jgi:hypothetical protein
MSTLNRAQRRRLAKEPPPTPQPDEQAAALVPGPEGEPRDAYFLTPLEARILLECVGKQPLEQVLGAWAAMKRQFEANMRSRAQQQPAPNADGV